jgi:two-component system, response regulator
MDRAETEILLVEDDPDDLELTLAALQKCSQVPRIQVVRDGEEALDFLFCTGRFSGRDSAKPPRVVFLDLKLPKVDGLQVLREVKNDPRTRGIPIVAMTSSVERRDMAEGYRLGVNSYVQKPVDFEAFRKLIQELGTYWLVMNRTFLQPPAPQH